MKKLLVALVKLNEAVEVMVSEHRADGWDRAEWSRPSAKADKDYTRALDDLRKLIEEL